MTRTAEEIETLKKKIEAIPAWYHAIDLGDGVVTPGPFDLTQSLKHYPLPEDMSGMRVLDVGSSNGFYAYEFERRGAKEVIALDLPSWLSHDWSPRKRAELLAYGEGERKAFDEEMMRASFVLVGEELKSKRVRKIELPIYEIAPEHTGEFDLVFCGAMLMHVRDPVRGIHAMRSVCKSDGHIIISISTIAEDNEEPLARFAGEWDQCNYWQMNPACLRKMLRCCDFEPTGKEVVYEEVGAGRAWRDNMFVCQARPRAV